MHKNGGYLKFYIIQLLTPNQIRNRLWQSVPKKMNSISTPKTLENTGWFTGSDIVSDGGVLMLRQMDKQLGLMKSIGRILPESREHDQVTHSQISLLRWRVFALCLGLKL